MRRAERRGQSRADQLIRGYRAIPAFAYYDLPHAEVKAARASEGGVPVLTLTADRPALFVTATAATPGYFSDNAITLLPGRAVRLAFTPRLDARARRPAPAKELRIRHLRQTY